MSARATGTGHARAELCPTATDSDEGRVGAEDADKVASRLEVPDPVEARHVREVVSRSNRDCPLSIKSVTSRRE